VTRWSPNARTVYSTMPSASLCRTSESARRPSQLHEGLLIVLAPGRGARKSPRRRRPTQLHSYPARLRRKARQVTTSSTSKPSGHIQPMISPQIPCRRRTRFCWLPQLPGAVQAQHLALPVAIKLPQIAPVRF
jgi:hypothetical protein